MTDAAQLEESMSPASSICSAVGTVSDRCGSVSDNGFHRRKALHNGSDSSNSATSVESSAPATTLHHVRKMIHQAARRHMECRCKCAMENKRLSDLVEKLQVALKRQKDELIVMQRNADDLMGKKEISVRNVQLQADFGAGQKEAEESSATAITNASCSKDLQRNPEQATQDRPVVVTKETAIGAKSVDDHIVSPKRQKAVKTIRYQPQPTAAKVACATQHKPAPTQTVPAHIINPVVQSRRLSEVHDASNGASVSPPTYLHATDHHSFPPAIHASTIMPKNERFYSTNGNSPRMPTSNSDSLNGLSNRIRSTATRPSLPTNAINGLAKEFVVIASQPPQNISATSLGSAKRKTDPMTPLHEVSLSKISRITNSSSPYTPSSLVLEADDIITLDDDDDDDDNMRSSDAVIPPRQL